MHGPDEQQPAMFSYLSPEERVPLDHPLRAIRQICDKILQQMSFPVRGDVFGDGTPFHCAGGVERALLLQVLYTVRSERMLMEQLNYNLLFLSRYTRGTG